MFSIVYKLSSSIIKAKVTAATGLPSSLQSSAVASRWAFIARSGRSLNHWRLSSELSAVTPGTTASHRSRSALTSALTAEIPSATSIVTKAVNHLTKVEVTLSNGETGPYPTAWLRDNCQCPNCFSQTILGRSFLMEGLKLPAEPKHVSVTQAGALEVTWEDGHRSAYSAEWLQQRAFTEEAREARRNEHRLPKTQWSSDHQVARFSYSSVMQDDRALLQWLQVLERWGASMLHDTPSQGDAAYNLCERTAKVKYTHYGDYSHVISHPNPNNFAFTNMELNLHNDMPQYLEIPGVIFLHMVKQHSGPGGDSVISDGLRSAEQMRKNHPQEFDILTTTDVYFWDKGETKDDMQMKQFYKINKGPTIQLDNRGEVSIIRFNNQMRDSFLDLPADEVNDFFRALKIYFNLLKANSISYKMKDGEITVLDNVRCQHGRKAFFGPDTGRHLVTTYMAWDEVLCQRRRLQEQFKERLAVDDLLHTK